MVFWFCGLVDLGFFNLLPIKSGIDGKWGPASDQGLTKTVHYTSACKECTMSLSVHLFSTMHFQPCYYVTEAAPSALCLLVSQALSLEVTLPVLYYTSSSMGQVRPHEFSFRHPSKNKQQFLTPQLPHGLGLQL